MRLSGGIEPRFLAVASTHEDLKGVMVLAYIAAYDLNREGADLLRLGDPQLIKLIIAGVEAAARHQAAGVRPDSSPRERAVRRTRR